MIKYLVKLPWVEIRKVKILRETKWFVVLFNGLKDAKASSGLKYCDTFQEAKDFLINSLQKELELVEVRERRLLRDIGIAERLKDE